MLHWLVLVGITEVGQNNELAGFPWLGSPNSPHQQTTSRSYKGGTSQQNSDNYTCDLLTSANCVKLIPTTFNTPHKVLTTNEEITRYHNSLSHSQMIPLVCPEEVILGQVCIVVQTTPITTILPSQVTMTRKHQHRYCLALT